MTGPFTPNSDSDDRDKLRGFLHAAEDLLASLAHEELSDSSSPRIAQELRELMMPAWEEVAAQFKDIQRSIASEWMEKLADAGLTGHQLAFKLAVIERLHTRFVETRRPDALARLLEGTASLVDSIVAATKSGEALKEFQQAVKLILEDAAAQ